MAIVKLSIGKPDVSLSLESKEVKGCWWQMFTTHTHARTPSHTRTHTHICTPTHTCAHSLANAHSHEQSSGPTDDDYEVLAIVSNHLLGNSSFHGWRQRESESTCVHVWEREREREQERRRGDTHGLPCEQQNIQDKLIHLVALEGWWTLAVESLLGIIQFVETGTNIVLERV